MCYYNMPYLNVKKILIIYIKYIPQITAPLLQLKHSSDVVIRDKNSLDNCDAILNLVDDLWN